MNRVILRVAPVVVAATTGLFTLSGTALAGTTTLLSGRAAAQPYVNAATSSALEDVVINPASTFAYFTVPSENEVAVLNLTTGRFGTSIPVGSDPQGIDITPNGKTLYVADSGGQTISRVTLATRKVKTIITPSSFLDDTPYSIAVMNNGNALYTTTFDGSGYGGHAYELNLTTDASKLVTAMGINGQVTEVTPVSRSANRAVVGAVIGDDSGGTYDIYTAATGAVVSGTLNEFVTASALNGKGSKMIVEGQVGTSVIDASNGAELGTINASCVSSALNASGLTGYCLTATSIVELNISRFLTGKSISLPSGVTGTGETAISPNGKILVAVTSAGAAIVSI